MKKLLLLLSAIGMIATACQTDATTDKIIGVGNGEEGTTLAVSLAETRTSLGEKVGTSYPVYWSEGDKLVVNGYLSDEVQINEDNRASALFTFEKAELSHPFYITYPYSASSTAEQPIVEFLAEQTYTEGTFAAGYAPMCGYTENRGDRIVLSHLAATLRIPVKSSYEGVVLDKVVITSSNKIAGEFAVDCKNATISATEICGNIVTYSLPENFALSTSTTRDLFITLPAINVGSCTIEFVEDSGKKMVAKWAPNAPLSKGVVREFKPITYTERATVNLEPLTVEDDEFTIFYKNLSGYVRYSDGSPIKGVAVSDGFQVVTTNENGYYELNGVTRDTWYIYCSLPSDVKVPIDELGRPCYFQKYEANKREYNFSFEKLPGGVEKEFALLALADVQPTSIGHIDRFRLQASPEIKSFTTKMSTPCYGIALGDIISNTSGDREHMFEPIQQALAAKNTGIPVFAVYGNHDNCDYNEQHPVFADNRSSTYNLKIQRAFEDTFGPANYSFNRGDVHIVTLRNTQYNDNIHTDGHYSMYFTDEQYAWLQQDLALVDKSKTVIFCVHIPIFNYKNNTHIQEVLALLNQFREAHILSGHLHYRKCYDFAEDGYDNIFEQSWSSCGAVANGNGVNIACDGAPIGYGVIVIRNGEMIKSIHKGYAHGMNDESYQIRLHRGGDITGAAISGTNSNSTKGYYQFPYENNVILANVFSSDPWNWTVEVWNYDEATGERTTKIGDMISLSAYSQTPAWGKLIGSFTYEDPKRPAEGVESARDFWTIGITLGYLGKTLQHNYHWNVCNTMWKYVLSDADVNAKVMVIARDRWGNEYTQTEFQVGTDTTYAIYDPANNPVVE